MLNIKIKGKQNEIEKFQQILDNLDLKKEIDSLKAERKELRNGNVDIGLKLKNLKMNFDSLQLVQEELREKNDSDWIKVKKYKFEKKELKHKIYEHEETIKNQKNKFGIINSDFVAGKEMMDKMVINLSTMKDKVVAIKDENNFLKTTNDNLTLKNKLGLESLTPRPQYHAIILEKEVQSYDDFIIDYIKKPNITSTNIVEYLFDKLRDYHTKYKTKTSLNSSADD